MEPLKSAANGAVTAGLVLLSVIVWLMMIPAWVIVTGIIYWRRRTKDTGRQSLPMEHGEAGA